MTTDEAQAAPSSNPCAWCRMSDGVPPWPGPEPRDFQIRRCRNCGHHYTVPVLTAAEVAPFYATEYYGDVNRRFNPLMERAVKWFRRRRAQALTNLTKPGRVLDIGCGRGLTLAALRDLGWQPQGCELSDSAARHARDVLKLDVACHGFEPERYADGQFDAVILWHVFEHLADAGTALREIARILKPGGVLALAVPNFESYQARWTRYGWFHLDMPRHYSHFRGSWLRERMAELGLDVTRESHSSIEQNVYGWIQSCLNRWGLRRNLLYDLLRNRSARSLKSPWREAPGQSLFSLLGMFVLMPFAITMTIVEAGTRRGGTVDLYAVKRGSNPSA